MSDADREVIEADAAPAPVEELQQPGRVRHAPWRGIALALAAALVLIVALVATAPLWAPLLPWGEPAAKRNAEQQFGVRLDRLAAEQGELRQQFGRTASETQQLRQTMTETNAALQRTGQRIGALEAKPAAAAADIAEMRQELAKLTATAAGLTARVDGIDKAEHAQAAHATTGTALALALLQIREGVTAGRPFAAEYETLQTTARGRSDIVEAAAPLAGPAKSGVATIAVLAKGLRDLAATVASSTAQPAGHRWSDAVLARLGSLVTIRRLDGEAKAGSPQAALNAAELALAGRDLPGAVGALDKLSGPAADAAAPWLRMARERLAVDSALQRIEALLAAGLGAAAPRPPG